MANILEEHKQLAQKYQVEILTDGNLKEGLKADEFNAIYEKILDTYLEYKTKILGAQDKIKLVIGANTSKGSESSRDLEHKEKGQPEFRLPKITLPSFSGGYECWRPFRDLFVSLIHENKSLSDVQKLHYLKSSVTGEVERLLQHLPIDSGNYQRAWEILVERYDHKRVLVNTQLKLLFEQAAINNETAKNIKQLLDTSQEIIHALSNLGIPVTSWDIILIFIIIQKAGNSVQKMWEEKLGNEKELPTLKQFFDFLQCRFRTLEAVEQSTGKSICKNKANVQSYFTKRESNKEFTYRLCHEEHHSLRQCKKFLNMNIDQRRKAVYDVRVCENCLAYSHFKQKCPSSKNCYYCKRRHNTLLHDSSRVSQAVKNGGGSGQSSSQSTPQNNTANSYQMSSINPQAPEFQPYHEQASTSAHLNSYHLHTSSAVLLATALIKARASDGSFVTLRALVDSGSEASFITESAIQQLRLKTEQTRVEVNGLGRVCSGTSHKVVDLEMQSMTSSFAGRCRALVFTSLTGLLPAQKINFDRWPHLLGLKLADPTFRQPGRVDVLLGSDVYDQIVLGEVRRGGSIGPIAQSTHLGWILLGTVPQTTSMSIRTFTNQLELDKTLRKFWEVEELPAEKEENEVNNSCEKFFQTNTVRLPNGHYKVCLPFKGFQHPKMGPSKETAVRRFLALEKRLNLQPKLYCEYSKCLKEYLQLGHMTLIDDEEVRKTPHHFFIPHHAVIKASSTTTRVRVVFDATQKSLFGASLNDMLHVGPKLQTTVCDIIQRWRRYKFTFTGDVEKMYRQISVDTSDANYQLIVWRSNKLEELKTYRLETVTFGTASAPYLAIRVLQKLADDEAARFPSGRSIIKEETYVDDVISGGDTVEEAQERLQEVRQLLAAGGISLRKHASNTSDVLKYIPAEQCDLDFSVPCDDKSSFKTLGVKWFPKSDTFSFQVARNIEEAVTKRSVLSSIAKIYDPMGWISPCIIKAKILMQQLWGQNIDWDNPIPQNLRREWEAFRDDLPSIENVRIPRWINTTKTSKMVEVHGFSDASEKAYAAAVYLRVLDQNQHIHMHLLVSKTKVAPLKTIILPRLELCGAVLLANLLCQVKRSLKLDEVNTWAWTDSIITLCWINAAPSKWKTFVGHRVATIQKLTKFSKWRHVPSGLNPADIASRGVCPSAIVQNNLWWSGPTFLRQQWKATFPSQPSYLETQEEVRAKVASHALKTQSVSLINDILERHSTLNKAKRILAYCLRMRHNTNRNRGCLTPQELEMALLCMIKSIQREMFTGDEEENNTTKGYKTLNPFRDDKGILRVGGRLSNSSLPYNTKYPILLKSDHRLVKLIISEAHLQTLPGGNQKVIAYVRQKFWIFNIRNAVKRCIHDCTICYRFRAKPLQQLMGDLPAVRTAMSKPFAHSGVDYAGPIDVKTWKGRKAKVLKGYFAIFVCMATKAIHIELVGDMTTQSFIAAFRRFVARRGLCRQLFSDCGRNFVGGNTELQRQLREAQVSWEKIKGLLANEGTKWNFIPPASPHFGGLWEAGVKSIKFHLKRVVGNQILTFEELSTLLAQVEACLNSRPLCPLSDNIDDYQPLTPAHFLVGEPLIAPPQPDYNIVQLSHLDRWKRVQTLTQAFWKAWSSDHLAKLQQSPKWMKKVPNELKLGDLVLVKDERLPPLKWSLGRITKLHPGPDGLVRVATIKTESSELKRPITKICRLQREDRIDKHYNYKPNQTKKRRIKFLETKNNQ